MVNVARNTLATAVALLGIGASGAWIGQAHSQADREKSTPGRDRPDGPLHAQNNRPGPRCAVELGSMPMEEPIRPHHAQAQESLRAMRIPGSKHGAPGVTASIAWRGLVLMKDAAQSATGVKGRMVAREATTGKIVWEFLLVPKTAVAAGGATAADYEEPCKDPTEARTPWLHLQRVRADERPAPKESPTNRR